MKQNSQYLYDLVRTGFGNKPEQTEEFIGKFDLSSCDFVDEFQTSLLQTAISSRKYDIAQFLIENECNLDNQDDRDNTALIYLLTGYNDDDKEIYDNLIDRLLEKDIDLNLKNKYANQALWCAVMNAKVPLEVIGKLLEKGGDPHHKNRAGRSAYDMVKVFNIPELNEMFEPYIKK